MINTPRQEAIKLGLKHYYTGKPCLNGHLATRQVSNKACSACVKAKKPAHDAAYNSRNKEKIAATKALYRLANWSEIRKKEIEWKKNNPGYMDSWRARNQDKVKAHRVTYWKTNKEKLTPKLVKYRERNKEQIAAFKARWGKENAAHLNAKNSRRKALKLQATPIWADEFIIHEIYDLARLRTKKTGLIWHTDHIVPLKSKLVCGLHCEFNLAVVPGKENLSKNNRRWPDMPGKGAA